MFKMASANLFGRNAVIVEPEPETAAEIAQDLRRSGGYAMATVPSVDAALIYIERHDRPDCIILDVRQISEQRRPLTEVFAQLGIDVVFVTGFDDWFLEDEDEISLSVANYAHG